MFSKTKNIKYSKLSVVQATTEDLAMYPTRTRAFTLFKFFVGLEK